jgi:hypothetical protein
VTGVQTCALPISSFVAISAGLVLVARSFDREMGALHESIQTLNHLLRLDTALLASPAPVLQGSSMVAEVASVLTVSLGRPSTVLFQEYRGMWKQQNGGYPEGGGHDLAAIEEESASGPVRFRLVHAAGSDSTLSTAVLRLNPGGVIIPVVRRQPIPTAP